MSRWLFPATFVLVAAILVGVAWLRLAQPQRDGEILLQGFSAPVRVTFDEHAVPTIRGNSQADVSRALGFVTAGDRLFQMDLIRRKAAGRLSEVFGAAALPHDTAQRHLGLERAAVNIVRQLPLWQRTQLKAYAAGVNLYLRHSRFLPFEFTLLGYQPEPWSESDSLLVALSMFQMLSFTDGEERMMTVMKQTLPDVVRNFLTPDTDAYTRTLAGGEVAPRPVIPVPAQELNRLRAQSRALPAVVRLQPQAPPAGSNHWVVGPSRTRDGRPILANDMHLPLSVPNIWYRAAMQYGDVSVDGVTLPGLPLLVAGSNQWLAWGFTNLMADVLDLVRLEVNPANPDQYRGTDGWKQFQVLRSTVRVKDQDLVELQIRNTEWGPVLQKPLDGTPVALKWTALDPAAVDLELMYLHAARSVESAIARISAAGGPPMNVVFADSGGNIGWAIIGRIPRRQGFDGSISRFWGRDSLGWSGYIPAAELPVIVNPQQGFIVTANNRTLGAEYPYRLGHNYAFGYRAHRIRERLSAAGPLTQKEMYRLQLDTRSEFYEFYRRLALQVIDAESGDDADAQEVRREIEAWDGHARSASRGLSLLVEFRNLLSREVFAPFLKTCYQLDPEFEYSWFKKDTPLRQLVSSKIPETLPDPVHFRGWNQYLRSRLMQSAKNLKTRYDSGTLRALTWGKINRAELAHPLARGLPQLAGLLNMEAVEMGGCGHCVRVIQREFGASERFVVSPGDSGSGIFNMPGGQSGRPFSRYYSDQQSSWVRGIARPFHSARVESSLLIRPGNPPP